jgi:hypothetical protein
VTLGNNLHYQRGLLDSGANVHIATLLLAQYLNLSIINFKKPVLIKTADKDSSMSAIGFIKIGGYIGDMIVVPQAGQNLISTSLLQEKKLNVIFNDDNTCDIRVNTHNMHVDRNIASGLYYIQIKDFITSDLNKTFQSDYQPLFTINQQDTWDGNYGQILFAAPNEKIESRKIKRIQSLSKEKISMGRKLHHNLGHISYRTLALAIRDGFIRNVNLTYDEMMTIASHSDCDACANAKWTQTPKAIGSGVRMDVPFHTISVDRLGPYNPAAYGGFQYAIIAMDTTTLFGIAHLYKSITATQYVKFIEEIRLFALRFHYQIKRVRFDAGSVEMQ